MKKFNYKGKNNEENSWNWENNLEEENLGNYYQLIRTFE